jgi:hypothetical protein
VKPTGLIILVLPGLLAVVPAAAQTVVRQPVALDSARAALRADLVALRDSLITIDGAAARLQRDYRTASEELLLSRALLMRDACARSTRAVAPTRRAIQEITLSAPQPVQRRREVLLTLDTLQKALRRCETEFTELGRPGQAETIRGYANHRAATVQKTIRVYESKLQPFLAALGIRILPAGANASR